MLNELEKLAKDELLLIAKKYHLYNAEKMNKKELIENILNVSGESQFLNNKEKDVKVKKTNGTIIYFWIFNLLILLLITMTFAQYFTRFYFNRKLFSDWSGLLLSTLSIGWSGFVYYYWWKHKTFNIFFLINILLSFGYFLHFITSYGKSVNALNKMNNINKTMNLYKTLFYVWLSLSISLSSAIGILLIIKHVKY